MATYRYGKSGLRTTTKAGTGKGKYTVTSGAGRPTRRTATVKVGKNTYSSVSYTKAR
jgi:hypothetical protein